MNDALEYHRLSLNNSDYNFDFDCSYNKENQELITPIESINRILDVFLRQESLLIDKAIDSIFSADDLADLLNEYDDIDAEVISDYTEIDTTKIKMNDTNWDTKTKDLIEDFSENTDAYISAMRSRNIQDWGSRNRIKNLTREELRNDIPFSIQISENIKSAIFLKEILPLFLKYRINFKNTKDFLSYLKNSNFKTQSILPVTLLLNELFLEYYGISENKVFLESKHFLKLWSKNQNG